MKNNTLPVGKTFLFLLLLFFPIVVFSQSGIELIIPEGIKSHSLTIVQNQDRTQTVFFERERNKIIVWDLINNKEKFNVRLSSKISDIAYHTSNKYIYASTAESVYIIDAESGSIISQRTGTNYIKENFSPFIDNQYLYIKDNQLYIADIFSEEDKKLEITDEDFYLVTANYDPNSQKLLLFTGYTGIYVYDKNLNPFSQQTIDDYYSAYYIFDNKLVSYTSGTSPTFKVYDLKSAKLTNEITIQQDGYYSFHDKTRKYIDHHQDKLFLYENDKILIRDLITGKTMQSIPLKINEVHDIVLSEDKSSLLVYGVKPDANHESEVLIYDLTSYSPKQFANPIENQDHRTSSVAFDDKNFYVYRFTKNQILKNPVLTGVLTNSFHFGKDKEIDTYPTKPAIVNNKYILVVLQDEAYKKSIACIDAQTNKLLWTFDKIESSYFQTKIDQKQEILTIIDEGYPNNTYTILDIVTGKTLFQENSTERLKIYPVNKDRVLQLSTYEGGDWSNPIRELHISEHFISENKTTLHKIPTKNSISDALLTENHLYVKYKDRLLTFDLDNLSRVADSISLEMQDYDKLIDIYNNRYLYICSNKMEDNIFMAYDLTDQKPILEQRDLAFIDYLKPSKKILLKNNKEDLYLFDIVTQQLSSTQVNLSETRHLKTFHDRWLVYKAGKNENIYDLTNNKVKYRLDESDIISVSRDGNLYYDYKKIKHTKDGSDFVALADEVAIPSSMSQVSFGDKPDEIVYIDDKHVLNLLDLSNKKLATFQPFSTGYSSHGMKYEKLSDNLLLVNLEDEYKILDINTGNVINLSENAFEIADFEVDEELLIVTESDKLKIFNLTNAEQLFEAESFEHKKLDKTLVVFRDTEKIYLYDTDRNRILWETELPLYLGGGQFSTILENTIFTTINEKEIGALDLRTGKIKSRHTLPSNIFTLGSFFSVEPLSIHPQTNHLYVNTGSLEETKYQIFDYKSDEFIALDIEVKKAIDIPQLKADYQIHEHDNFSLNENILAVYKYDTKQFSVYDTESKATLFEQNAALHNEGLTWEVMDSQKIIFLYNRLGDILFIDYANNKSSQHKIDGNKFKIHDKRLFVSDYGKKIDVYECKNIENLTKLYSLIPMSNGEYMFYTEGGYYLSTKGGAKNLQFKQNEQLYSFEQFDLLYNRPDIVLKAMKSPNSELIKMYENAYQKRLQRQDYTISSAMELAPETHIILKNNLSESQEKYIDIDINADAKADRLSKVVIKVNDNLYKEIPTQSKTHQAKETIALNSGQNTIEVYALNNNNVKGISDKLDIFYKEEELNTPKVYFFGIGVSDYKDDNFNLKYASKDIQDMVGALSDRYPNMDVNVLLNNDVTVENIEKFKEKLAQTQTDDIVILSFCGHGVLDEDYNWYFATHDLDFKNPKMRGFSYEKLIDLTNNIQSRQKLITLDACHSGEVDTDEIGSHAHQINHQDDSSPEESGSVVATKRGAAAKRIANKDGGKTSFALMKQMFSELESSNGTIVISASGGMEYAFEGGSYSNGVFTYSILSLLYDSVWNTLKISKLQKAVMENVYKLTNGKQQPNVRTGTLNYDWVVW